MLTQATIKTGASGGAPARRDDALVGGDAPAEPASADPARSLERGRALLDSALRITDIDGPLARWLGAAPEELPGACFAELLQRRCPEAGPLLARALGEASPWARYRFQAVAEAIKGWYELEVAGNPGGWFLGLTSILPPPAGPCQDQAHKPGEKSSDADSWQPRLRRAESQLAKLVQRWPGVLFSQDVAFAFRSASGKFEELTGLSPEASTGAPRCFWDIVHEADVEELKRQCGRAVNTPAGVTTTYRIRNTVSGKISYVLEFREAVVDDAGVLLGYEGAWLDITRQTLAERRLSIAAWKENLDLLTMGLAHDLNNCLSRILSLAELILAKSAPESPHIRQLNLIKQSSFQAGQLMQRVVGLHRGTTGIRQYVDLAQFVTELAELVRKVLPRGVQLETELAPGEFPVYIDEVGFRQVVLNLALNAADAMPNGGRLVFRLDAPASEQPLPHGHGKFPRLPSVCLSVQDSGTGISPRHLPHVFDPFFTTKPLTKSSGLGLYHARLVIEGHGGAISVDSTEGAGATFHLWLPLADFTEAERLAGQDAPRRHSLLLVGQADAATNALADFLRAHHFSVIVTHSAGRALELLAAEETPVGAVVVLADANDGALLRLVPELRDRRLATRVILQVLGSNTDRVDARVLDKASLVLAHNVEEGVLLKRIQDLCAESPG